MPFKKGENGRTPRESKSVIKPKEEKLNPLDDLNDSVMDEMQVSAVQTDEIVPKAPEKPRQVEKSMTIPQIQDEDDFSEIYGWTMADLEFMDPGLNHVPKPPKCVMEWCNQRNLKWRWMSYPNVKHQGMRGHVAFSVTPEIRKKIKRGDCPPTIDIDVSNKLVWREDAFLGVIPRRLADELKKKLDQRTIDQTKLAKAAPGGLREYAERAGGKIVEYSVDETSRQGL